MIRNEFVLAIFGGVAAAVPYLLYAIRVRNPRRLFAIGLVITAFVYVVFAMFGGTRDALLIELGGAVIFVIVTALGLRYSIYFLAFGWAAHVAWDLLLHPIGVSSYAPWWYPVACVGFDLVVAGAVVGSRTRDPV